MDIRKVKKLIELLEESNIGEIEIKEGEESVRISRQGAAPAPLPARSTRDATRLNPRAECDRLLVTGSVTGSM